MSLFLEIDVTAARRPIPASGDEFFSRRYEEKLFARPSACDLGISGVQEIQDHHFYRKSNMKVDATADVALR